MLIIFMFSTMWLSAMVIAVITSSHFISFMLMLESAVVMMYVLFYASSSESMKNLVIIYLTFTVCESALGLSIMISLGRLLTLEMFLLKSLK